VNSSARALLGHGRGCGEKVEALGQETRHQAREFLGHNFDRLAQATADFVGHVDIEAFDAAAQFRHRVRRECAVEACHQFLCRSRYGNGHAERAGDGKKTHGFHWIPPRLTSKG
jgi:hypothetical protein